MVNSLTSAFVVETIHESFVVTVSVTLLLHPVNVNVNATRPITTIGIKIFLFIVDYFKKDKKVGPDCPKGLKPRVARNDGPLLLDNDASLIHSHSSADDIIGSCLGIVYSYRNWRSCSDWIDVFIKSWEGHGAHTSSSIFCWGDNKLVTFSCFERHSFWIKSECCVSDIDCFIT